MTEQDKKTILEALEFGLNECGVKDNDHQTHFNVFANAIELVKKLAIPDVSQQRELLIGYSKLILGDNYEAFEEFELKKIDEYLANL
tara:strand:- start:271 stop:531 length:261 start_codon:yes stop_codon:yes gene_type:complete